MQSSVFEDISSSSVVTIPSVEPAYFVRPTKGYVTGRPEALGQDQLGYLVPDPTWATKLYLEGIEAASKPLAITRQSKAMISKIIAHQEARSLKGLHKMEKYLVLEGSGGIGKSYTIQWFFGRLGAPIICDKVPPNLDAADEKLFGNPHALNTDPYNLIETAKLFYAGRGFRHPETLRFLKKHPRELYMALFPGQEGWFISNTEAYCSFWEKVASLEGLIVGQKTVPKLGLFELCYRNGFTLFLDELSRMKRSTLDLCMRAFEDGKNLETNTGTVLASEKHPCAQVIGAQNGAEQDFDIVATDKAHLRRQKKPAIPEYNATDYKEFIAFQITGQNKITQDFIITETGTAQTDGAVCTREFLEKSTVTNAKKTKALKLNALSEFAQFHIYMETQIHQILEGSGMADGEDIKTRELILTGPPLIKEFFDRTYQLIAYQGPQSKGFYAGIELITQAFQEIYIEPLTKRGIPQAKVASIVNFGLFGSMDCQGKQLSPKVLGHIVSLFCPLREADLMNLGADNHPLEPYLEENGLYPAIGKSNKECVIVCTRKNNKLCLKESSEPFPIFTKPACKLPSIKLHISSVTFDNVRTAFA